MNNESNAALALELKQLIIQTLDLEDVTPEDILDEAPLFVEGLGLDSIDSLELGVALQKNYGIKLDGEAENTRQHFASVSSLCALVSEYRVPQE